MEHTPTPWRVSDGIDRRIVASDGMPVAKPIAMNVEHNAAFIVRAVNNHAKLLEALIDLDKVFDFSQRLDPGDFDIEDHSFSSAAFIQAREAIEEARK